MLFYQHVAWCDEMCSTSQTASSLFWTILGCLCQTSQTASLSVLRFVVAVCYCIMYAFHVRLIRVRGRHRDSGRCGTAHAQTNGSWWDGSRSFFFMRDAVAMIHAMIKQGPPRLGWPLFFSRKRPLGVSGLEAVGL